VLQKLFLLQQKK